MKRTFSKEFKIEACKLVIQDGLKPSIVAEKMGINVVMLYRWVDEYQTDPQNALWGGLELNSIFAIMLLLLITV